MAAIMNGVALHGGFIPYGGTFLTFSDYSRNALRMAALMKQRVIYVFTHDSIGLGEDGPTHQSIEHAASLRLIPQPGRLASVRHASRRRSPGRRRSSAATARRALLLSRQNLPFAAARRRRRDRRHRAAAATCSPDAAGGGARRRSSSPPAPKCSWRSQAQKQLAADGHRGARGRRCRRPTRLRPPGRGLQARRVLPAGVPRVAVEAGVTDFWWKYVGCDGAVVGIDRFGESAPAGVLFKHFGFTAENVADTVRVVLT